MDRSRGGRIGRKKYSRLSTAVTAAIIVLAVSGVAMASLALWGGNGILNTSSKGAAISFTETVYVNGTNAVQTPLEVSSNMATFYATTSNTGPSGLHTYDTIANEIGSYKGVTRGDATVGVNVGNFLAGSWVRLSIYITNTGTAALALNTGPDSVMHVQNTTLDPAYSLGTYYSSPDVVLSTLAPSLSSACGGPGAAGDTMVNQTWYGSVWNDVTWDGIFSSNGASSVPAYLPVGGTWSYSLYLGLGYNAPATYEGAVLGMNIQLPLIPVR